MAAIENSIAANVNRADKVRQHINGLGTNYKNTNPGQTVADFTTTIGGLNTTITDLVKDRDTLDKKTLFRYNYLKKNNTGLQELMLNLKAGLFSQYKGKSPVYKKGKALIDKFRSTSAKKPPKPNLKDGSPAKLPKSRSEFQSGFDSKEGILNDINALINKQDDYKPVNPNLTKAKINTATTTATNSNDEVFAAWIVVNTDLKTRQKLYTYMFYDTKYIKEYLKGAFGNESTEYRTVSSLVISKLKFVPKKDPR